MQEGGTSSFLSSISGPVSFFRSDSSDSSGSSPPFDEGSFVIDDLLLAKQQLEETLAEYNSAESILRNCTSQATDYAESLISRKSESAEQASLKRQIAELVVEVEELSYALEDEKRYVDPDTLEQMENDIKEYNKEIQGQRRKLKAIQKKVQEETMRLLGMLTNDKWREAVSTLTEHQIATRIRNELTTNVKPSADAREKQKEEMVPVDSVKSELLPLLQKRRQLELECQETQNRRKAAQVRKRVNIANLLDELQRLDMALKTLGHEGIQLNELRRNYLPEGPYSPMKRPKSSGEASRGKYELTPKTTTGRSQSDLKRPIKTNKSYISRIGKF